VVNVSKETLQQQYILVIVDIYVEFKAELMHKFILNAWLKFLEDVIKGWNYVEPVCIVWLIQWLKTTIEQFDG